MIRSLSRSALLAALLASPSAFAFTPESGFWWNPAEPGTGFNIEVQDNFVGVTAYYFRADGSTAWFISAGPFQPNGSGGAGNSFYSGTLDGFSGGQCIGCAYTNYPNVQSGAGGPISINFLTERTATVTIGGRTSSIQRQSFRLGNDTERMLGEWQVVLDLHAYNDDYEDYPYVGDVLKVDVVNTQPNPDEYYGCRPNTTDEAKCVGSALADHPLEGWYDATDDTHVISVVDVPAQAQGPTIRFTYFVKAALDQFTGVVVIHDEDDVVDDNDTSYPVRGFRSASRSFVVTGSGPASADKSSPAPTRGISQLLARANGGAVKGRTVGEAKSALGFDPVAIMARHRAARAGTN